MASVRSLAVSAKDAAHGALLGACVGDAAGAVLEFESDISPAQVQAALRMPGGGCWHVGPGQVTDDSEMALCLLQGLLASAPPKLPIEDIARKYAEWHRSEPFDTGVTTGGAARAMARAVTNGRPIADAGIRHAADHSRNSQSNGALMRATPLAIWGHRLSDASLAESCRREASLTHSHSVAQDCNVAYCLAIGSLIRQPGNAEAAVARAEAWAWEHAEQAVVAWLAESAEERPQLNCTHQIGFVRWGFVLAFRHLRLETAFEEAIADTLQRGGDTDTNAAIVGGLLGALHGATAIPSSMKDPVLARSVESPGRSRPSFLQTSELPKLVDLLFKCATTHAEEWRRD